MDTHTNMYNENSSKPHVAFISSPGMGHITPLLEFAFHLVTQHSIQVTFLVITIGSSDAQNNYIKALSPHPDLHIVDLPPANMSGILTDDMTAVAHLSLIVQESIRPLHSMLLRLNRTKVLTAMVIDIFCTPVFEVCKDLSIPIYSYFTASATLLTFSLYLPTLDREVEGEFMDLLEPVKVPGCNPIRIQDLLEQVRDRKIDEYKWYLLHASRLSMAKGIFVNTWDDLEPVPLSAVTHKRLDEYIPTPPVYPIGPLTKQMEVVASEDEKETIGWLDKQPKDSVLFVALGSGGTLTSEQLTELAWGLELSQQHFILVVRKPSDCASSALFSSGCESHDDPRSFLPDGFVERTKGVGLVVSSWAPQVAVLNHPSTGAFLSHCGWNSTLESVLQGVPMIAWPMYAEQRMNATMLSDEVGVAVKMPVVGEAGETVVVGRDEIERVVRMVMEGEEGKKLRTRAKELKESGRATLSPGGSSYETLTRVVESWKLET
uniref:UDP-glycosyltransferase 72B1-like n=1 Tax=Erigeron canadensis TaxID=72917 RepID=UPI001CB942EF|nr:UDP-glycosyltransferase 72B1-like [Erigeron canadensis]